MDFEKEKNRRSEQMVRRGIIAQFKNYSIAHPVKESNEFLEDFLAEFQNMTLQEQKEGMRRIVKQGILARGKSIARCFLSPLLIAKHNSLLEGMNYREIIEGSVCQNQ